MKHPFKIGDIVTAKGMLGSYIITSFDGSSAAFLKPLQHIVDSETRYHKGIKNLRMAV